MEILERKIKEHKIVHKENEKKLQDEIDEMNEELRKIKDVVEKKEAEANSNEELFIPVQLSSKSLSESGLRQEKVSSLYVEVGDLEENILTDDEDSKVK